MATRRRYRDGGRVPLEGASADADVTSSPPPSVAATPTLPEVEPTPPPISEPPLATPEASDPLRRVLDQSRHADELQKQAADQAGQREQEIAAMPVSDFKKDTLRIIPKELWPLLGQHWHAALSEGVRDDTPEIRLRIISGIQRDLEAAQGAGQDGLRQETAPDRADASVSGETFEPDMTTAADLTAFRNPSFTATPMAMTADLPSLPPAPRGRSIPVSAPVSREIPAPSGQKVSADKTVTLNAEERDMAHRSYHWLSKPEAEFEYAKQKQRLLRQRADGSYSG